MQQFSICDLSTFVRFISLVDDSQSAGGTWTDSVTEIPEIGCGLIGDPCPDV